MKQFFPSSYMIVRKTLGHVYKYGQACGHWKIGKNTYSVAK